MAFNINNFDDLDLNLVRDYNQRAAALISTGETLIPLQALHKYFPSLFKDKKPRVNQEDLLLCQAYQPPNDTSFTASNASNASVNSQQHITNNNTNGNWFNQQVQKFSNYAVDQPSSGLGQPATTQPSGYPSNYDYASTNLVYPSDSVSADYSGYNANFQGQNSDWNNTVPVNSSTGPVYQYPVQNQYQPNMSTSFFPDMTTNQDTKSFDAALPHFNNGTALSNPVVPTWSSSNGTYMPQSVPAPDPSVGIAPVVQNMQIHRNNYNITSAMTAGVYPIPTPLDTFYPTTTTYPNSLYSLYPDQQTIPNPRPTSKPSSKRRVFPKSTFQDNVPGLYEQIGENTWRCTYEGCGQVSHYRRNRTRHVGKHAKKEEKLIEKGALKPEDAKAIPRMEFLTYECEIPDCRYFLETGKRYYVEEYRVDGLRFAHLKKYHGRRKTVKVLKGEEKGFE
ncbi:hypothetical protein Clacol_002449 [Clathrus columnatus]|uniref:C2H2-type domain-containing protein n=1 Tax=Clathrus columnatus TaxID=1419009 RepID=A0AAV5A5J2_9AGAM|nr:hypothetical protein Clacol_002449 [Clathrus columnatus]